MKRRRARALRSSMVAALAAVLVATSIPSHAAAPVDTGRAATPSEPRGPLVQDDPIRGRITAENRAVKVVFGYRTTSADGYNRGGGNLYEVYDKRTDPAMTRNLVASAPGGGGNTSNQGVGFGGVGSTGMYAWPTPPTADTWPRWRAYISDNRLDGATKDHAARVTPVGDIEAIFDVQVSNRHTATAWYRVQKIWLIEPSGRINLTLRWTLLRGGWLSEVSVRNQWSWDRGWTMLAKFGHDWGDPGCDDGLISDGARCPTNYWKHIPIGGVMGNCWNDENRFHAQKAALTGSASAPDILIEVVNRGPDGRNWGAEGGGLWRLNRVLTHGKEVDAVFEQCTYNRRGVGDGDAATGVGWYSWWGGDPATPERYRHVDLATHPDLARWQETLVFEMYPPSPPSVDRERGPQSP